ncbi:MAG: hypothetical protein A3F43_00105 [Gammaproteobacteria bacterium RIFCSPHIGHO2_12_FULL_42_10]|nr:MAG: hypothetical protein A3F43_00105 [Gammaproteobacteria bacterium RIFCSPHIGHO2_12_FULL_42_10]
MTDDRDLYWMQQALLLAVDAGRRGEVPVGALLVLDEVSIGVGYNRPIGDRDPTAHAEIIALRDAAKKINNYRLLDTTLYVTLEPCMMCAAAMVHARIKRLVYGAPDPKAGAIVSQAQILDAPFFNHRVAYYGNLLAMPCGELLRTFFKAKRLSST